MAEQARDVEISRSRGGSTLHQSVCIRLSVDPEGPDVTWDSYRSYDGRWVVTAYHAQQGVGTWYYEAVGRTVHPADASARALMGGGPTEVADVSITSDPTSDPTPEATSDEMPEGEEMSDTPTPATAQDTLIPEEAEAPKRAKRTKSKRGRASVPSWDEILFGATKDSE